MSGTRWLLAHIESCGEKYRELRTGPDLRSTLIYDERVAKLIAAMSARLSALKALAADADECGMSRRSLREANELLTKLEIAE